MNFLALLPWFRATAAPAAVPATTETVPQAEDSAEEPPLCGCGWFDSSQDLSQGLVVREDVAPAELPLANWLEGHLSGWACAPRPV